MDKPSERKKDAKERGDTDIGIHDYHPADGGKREQLEGLWSNATITGGSIVQRLGANNYKKTDHEDHERKKKNGLLDTLIDEHDTRGPPFLDTSKPARVF